jgi:tetratricopeptide (TPR) repeat protein
MPSLTSLSKILAVILLTIAAANAAAQELSLSDTAVIRRLLEKSNGVYLTDIAQAHKYVDKAIVLSKDKYPESFGRSIWQKAFIYFNEGQYDKAIIFYDSASTIFGQLKDSASQLETIGYLGMVYMYNGNFYNALTTLFKGLKISELIKDTANTAYLYNGIALTYESLTDWKNTLRYNFKSLRINLLLKDSMGIATSYSNIANAYNYQTKQDSAIYFQRKALDISSQQKDWKTVFNCLLNLGNYYTKKAQPDSAVYYHLLAEQYNGQVIDILKANNYLNLANAFQSKKDYPKMLYYAKKGELLAKDIPDFETQQNLNLLLSSYYKHTGDFQKAFGYLEKLAALNDSIHTQSQNTELQKLGIRYELNKKVLADSLFLQNKVNLANSEKTASNNRFVIAALLLLITLAIAVLMYNRSKLLEKRNIISEQEKTIALQKQIEYQLQALRSQMNPHFIFNCLNTIDSYILLNKQQDASYLIQQFSKLTRRILEHTSQTFIRIEEELETLAIYLKIEQIRANQLFTFSIDSDPILNQLLIPPMLLQPFVENAVVHGVRNRKEQGGMIRIIAKLESGFVIFTIEDNGVGRTKAAAIKTSQFGTMHKSLSMDLTKMRLQHLHDQRSQDEYIAFADLQDDGSGTKVVIKLPKLTSDEKDTQ